MFLSNHVEKTVDKVSVFHSPLGRLRSNGSTHRVYQQTHGENHDRKFTQMFGHTPEHTVYLPNKRARQ